ncbi:MAG: PilZ domain-containing protein [Myxococcaceae bacterium]
MGEEQRRSPRKSLQVDFRARDAGGAGQLLFEGRDLSTGGSFLRSDVLLEQDEDLTVEFRVPGVPRPLRAQARVAWVRRFPKFDETAGMGVQFIEMVDEDRTLLDDYLAGV